MAADDVHLCLVLAHKVAWAWAQQCLPQAWQVIHASQVLRCRSMKFAIHWLWKLPHIPIQINAIDVPAMLAWQHPAMVIVAICWHVHSCSLSVWQL